MRVNTAVQHVICVNILTILQISNMTVNKKRNKQKRAFKEVARNNDKNQNKSKEIILVKINNSNSNNNNLWTNFQCKCL